MAELALSRDGQAWPSIPGLLATDAGYSQIWVLQGDERRVGALLNALGLSPPAMLRAAAAEGLAALHLGPDEWMLLADGSQMDRMSVLAESDVSVIEISHAWATFDLEGPAIEAILQAGCPLDLHFAQFGIGMATRTLCGKCEVILWRRGLQHFFAGVIRSHAPALQGLLAEVARRNSPAF